MSLTPEDLESIQGIIETAIESKLEPIREEIRNIPTKEEYFNSMDALVKEIRDYRMERVTLNNKVERLELRVDNVETRVGKSTD